MCDIGYAIFLLCVKFRYTDDRCRYQLTETYLYIYVCGGVRVYIYLKVIPLTDPRRCGVSASGLQEDSVDLQHAHDRQNLVHTTVLR